MFRSHMYWRQFPHPQELGCNIGEVRVFEVLLVERKRLRKPEVVIQSKTLSCLPRTKRIRISVTTPPSRLTGGDGGLVLVLVERVIVYGHRPEAAARGMCVSILTNIKGWIPGAGHGAGSAGSEVLEVGAFVPTKALTVTREGARLSQCPKGAREVSLDFANVFKRP